MDGDVPAALTRLRSLAPAAMHADMSYWWTPGGRASLLRPLPAGVFRRLNSSLPS